MKKLGIACVLILTFGTPLVSNAYPMSVLLPVSNITVGPGQTLNIPLSLLAPGQPYSVSCNIADPNYLQNQVSIGPSYTGQMAPPYTSPVYLLNGVFFTSEASCSKTSETNALQVWVSSVTPTSSTVNIENLDKSDSIVVQNCAASPFTNTHASTH